MAAVNSEGVGLVQGRHCTAVVTLTTDLEVATRSSCVPASPKTAQISVSPDGRYVALVVDSAGGAQPQAQVIDVASGSVAPLSPLLARGSLFTGPGGFVWDSPEAMLFVVRTDTHAGTAVESLVRCSTDTGSCDMALRAVTGSARDDFFPPLALTPPFSY